MDGRKFSVLVAGGRRLSLRLSFNAMVDFNREVGPIQEAFDERPFEAFRAMVWAAANSATPGSLTLSEAGDFCEDFIAENGYDALNVEISALLNDSGWLKSAAEESEKNETPKGASQK